MNMSIVQPTSLLRQKNQSGFTIVELLIVIVVIGILASIIIVSYQGLQARAGDTRRQNDIHTAAKLIKLHKAATGSYPQTTTGNVADEVTGVTTDSNCDVGTKSSNWLPGIAPTLASQLPQSDGNRPYGPGSGCYKYWSNGTDYVLSAWGAAQAGPKEGELYRRLGFGDIQTSPGVYYCNNTENVGGGIPYNLADDIYKHSFTVSNISTCNETPPDPTAEAPEEPPAASGRTIYGVFVPQHVTDHIEATYPEYRYERVDDEGSGYEIRLERGDNEYRLDYDSSWQLTRTERH